MHDNLEKIMHHCYKITSKITLIIANGQFFNDRYINHLLEKANLVLCCDGAIKELDKLEITPNYIIGDCDSLTASLRQKYAGIIKYIPDQNTNDLTKSIEFVVKELSLDNIVIIGATGYREDHTLANISLLAEYTKHTTNIIMLSDYGFFSLHSGHSRISTLPKQQISLFTFGVKSCVTTYGLKWDLNNEILDGRLYKASLNEAISDEFELINTDMVVVYRSFELKN